MSENVETSSSVESPSDSTVSPVKKTTRRRTTKTTQAKAAEVDAQEAPAKAEPKTATRTRRKAASTTPAAAKAETASEGAAAAPKRASGRAKAASADASEPVAAPKRATRRTKTAVDDEPQEAPKTAARKRTSTRATAKKAAQATPDATPAAAEAPKPQPEKPLKETAAAEGSGEPEASKAPARKPRARRSTARSKENAEERSAAFSPEQSAEPSATAAQSEAAPQSAQGEEAPAKTESQSATREEGHSERAPRERQQQTRRNNGKNQQAASGKQERFSKQNGTNNQHRRQRRQHEQRSREVEPSVTLEELSELKVADLRARALELEIDPSGVKKADLVQAVFDATMKAEGFTEVEGVLDIMPEGYGFLRAKGYLPGEGDAYVGISTIRRNGLRKGDYVCGRTRPARENEKFAAIQKVTSVNDLPVEENMKRPKFADLTPVYPNERLLMEHGKQTISSRVIDLAAPIGKGQRGLIVSPPKAGKTTLLKDIAASITANNPEVKLICLLVDERPEEVTDMERSIRGEVVSSTFDMPCENHIAVAELVIERAKRLVEAGHDVVILLDSITRLARAYNLAQPASGRILSGGVDSTALYPPKRFFGAARNLEDGGSLTILASALIDTGSKMDEVIFEEFKGTGNMELKLDRNLADRRIFPAIDPVASGTRKEELLLDPQEAPLIWAVRRILANMNSTERSMDMLIKSLKQTDTNQEFLMRTAKKAQQSKSDDKLEL